MRDPVKFEDYLQSAPPSDGESKSGRLAWISRTGRKALQLRLLFYVLAGGLVLLFMLTLAKSLTPPDSALRQPAMTVKLGTWDGTWTGRETLYSLDGRKLAEFDSQREYFSSSSKLQTAQFTRSMDGEVVAEEAWVYTLGDDQPLQARSALESTPGPPFQGRIQQGSIFWHRETDSGRTVRRSWISENTLYTEEIQFPAAPSEEPTILMGTFTRAAE